MPEYRWVDSTASSSIPSDALEGGVDVDGTKIYVGKARYNNDEMPAKVIPGKRAAFVSYAGKEIFVNKFQVLCGLKRHEYDWIGVSGDRIPARSVKGGKSARDEDLYIGRASYQGSTTVGKVHNKILYIPFNGGEVSRRDYEILVLRS